MTHDKAVSFVEQELTQRKLASPENIPAIVLLFKTALNMSTESCAIIQFIANRKSYADSIYGTGEWSRGEKKAIPLDTARQMVKQPGVYLAVEGDVAGLNPVKIPELNKEAEQRKVDFFNQLDGINDPGQLRIVAKDNFQNWEPDGRIKDPFKIREAIKDHASSYGTF